MKSFSICVHGQSTVLTHVPTSPPTSFPFDSSRKKVSPVDEGSRPSNNDPSLCVGYYGREYQKVLFDPKYTLETQNLQSLIELINFFFNVTVATRRDRPDRSRCRQSQDSLSKHTWGFLRALLTPSLQVPIVYRESSDFLRKQNLCLSLWVYEQ